MAQRAYGKWKRLGIYAVIAIGIYIAIRCLFVAVVPFLAAILLLKMFYPLAEKLRCRLRIHPGISVFTMLIVSMGIVGIGLWFLAQVLFTQFAEIVRRLPACERYVDDFFQECCCRIEQYFGLRADFVKPYLLERMYAALEKFGSGLGDGMLTSCYQYAKYIIRFIGAFVVVIVVTVLLAKDYEKLKGSLERQDFYENIKALKEKVFHAAFVYVRAQLILIMIISTVCVVTLLLLGCGQACLIGILIGILDALPFFGTGAVLVPWALVQFFRGKVLYAAVLGTLYVICSFIRELLEPKLIGSKIGVFPVYVVAAVYVGIMLYGIGGVILGPLQALMTAEIGRQWIEEHEGKDISIK